MCVGRPFGGNNTFEDNLGRLIDGEFGTFDEVGEIGLKKGERGIRVGTAGRRFTSLGDAVPQRKHQGFEQLQTIRIIRLAGVARLADLALQLRFTRAEQRSNQAVEFSEFGVIAKLGRDPARIVANAVDGGRILSA